MTSAISTRKAVFGRFFVASSKGCLGIRFFEFAFECFLRLQSWERRNGRDYGKYYNGLCRDDYVQGSIPSFLADQRQGFEVWALLGSQKRVSQS